MTAGVLELNVVFLAVGVSIVWAIRGWQTWNDAGRDAGLAYLLGLMTVGVEGTLVLIAGGGITRATVGELALATVGLAAVVAVVRRTPLPHGLQLPRRPRTAGDLLTVLAAGVAVVFTAALYRAFRHEPVIAYDTWAFWVPKAQAIFYFDGLDERLFKTLPGSSYPLFVPTLDAMAYRFARTTSAFALDLQYWLLFVGFLGALPSLLRGLARRGLIALFAAVVAVLPEVAHRLFQLQADWPLDIFFVVAALLLLRWITSRERWALAAYPLALAATLATKREGQLLAACIVAAALLATVRTLRRDWPLLVGLSAAAYALNIPWRLWWTSRHLTPDTPPQYFGSLSRLFGSVKIVGELAFSYHLFLVVVPVAFAACLAAVAVRRTAPPAVYVLASLAFVFAGLTWILWTNDLYVLSTKNSATPLPRATASLALLSVVVSPVLLTQLVAPLPLPSLSLSPREAFLRERLRLAAWLRTVSPVRVLAVFVVAQWIEVAALAARVRHSGWLYYQGGDQLWYYTTSWLFAHGRFVQPGVGYLWSIVELPFAVVGGPNLMSSLPAIVLLQVLVLLPVALVCLYGIATRIAGRLFAYWTLALWLVVPFAGIVYTNTGYHQRYTELLLPQAFGLTGMADFVTMVATLVSVYFCIQVVLDERPSLFHALAGGVAAGAVVALKPSGGLFLVGVVLALAATARIVPALVFGAGLAPAVAVISFWKLRGFGHLPFALGPHSAAALLAAALPAPVLGLNVQQLWHFDWAHLSHEFDLLREHFWSGRLIQWLPVAGTIGLARRSRPAVLLVAGWFGAYVVVKGTYQYASIEDGSLLRIMIPSFPAFILLLASIPFVVPRLVERFAPQAGGIRTVGRRTRHVLVVAGILLTAVIPLAAIAAASPEQAHPTAAIVEQPPVPTEIDLGLSAQVRAGVVTLTWTPQRPVGGKVFIHVYRDPAAKDIYSCATTRSAWRCVVQATELKVVDGSTFVDRHPPKGASSYRISVGADWLGDPRFTDVYLVSKPVVVSVP